MAQIGRNHTILKRSSSQGDLACPLSPSIKKQPKLPLAVSKSKANATIAINAIAQQGQVPKLEHLKSLALWGTYEDKNDPNTDKLKAQHAVSMIRRKRLPSTASLKALYTDLKAKNS